MFPDPEFDNMQEAMYELGNIVGIDVLAEMERAENDANKRT